MNQLLEQSFLGNTVLEWGTALVVAVITYVVVRLAISLGARRLRKLAEYTDNAYDDLALDLVSSTKFLVLVTVALYAGSQVLRLDDGKVQLIDSIVVIVLIVQAAIWGNDVISFVLDRVMKQRLEEDAASATMVTGIGFVARLVFFTMIVLVALETLGWDVTALVTGLGIGGIAVALAVQNILGDLFASLSIILDKPFVIGDFIVVDDFAGTVENIGLKTTRVRSLSGEQVVMSNSDLLSSRLRNFKRMTERRAVFTVGVTYDTPADKLARIPEIIESVIVDEEMARFDRCHFAKFGDSSLNYEIVLWITSPDYLVFMDTQQSVNLDIVQRFREEGIEFAFPTRTLHVETLAGGGAGEKPGAGRAPEAAETSEAGPAPEPGEAPA